MRSTHSRTPATLRCLAPVVLLTLLALIAGCAGDGEPSTAPAEPTAGPIVEPPVEPAPSPSPEAQAEAETEAEAEPDPTATAVPTVTDDLAVTDGGSGCGAGAATGTTTVTFPFEGRDRVYQQVLPSSYDDATPLPVVLNWHGLGSNGPDQITFSDYARLAEAEGFVVIAPTGVPAPGESRNSWELTPETDPTRDDLAFAGALLDNVIETLCVDPTRVYSTGMSNGGYFTSLLVCNMSDRIAAAASVAALTHPDDCSPERTVPYIGFHGTDDEVVPYAGGGVSTLAPDQIIPLFQLEIDAEFAEFATAAGCAVEPVETSVAEDVTAFDYPDCPDGVAMTFYRIEGGGHTWPGSIGSLLISQAAGLGVTSSQIDASRVSWEFFEQYSLDD